MKDEITIKFLGSGSAFVLGNENYQSNIIISKNVKNGKKYLLYDAGTSIADSLDNANIRPVDLDTIYISHLHADHIGGIEYIAFKTYFEQYPFGENKINLKANKNVLTKAWDNSWKGGLESIQGSRNTLESYFNTRYMNDNEKFDFYGTEIKPIETKHVIDDISDVPSYGLKFTHNNKNVYISGDSQFDIDKISIFNECDIIFHDCEFAEYPNSVHAQFHQLKTLPLEIKAKMYLYHYMLKGIEYNDLNNEAKQNGFAGLVKRSQEFKI